MTDGVVVVGAGIVGVAVADELSRAGHPVTLVEADRPLRGATSAGMGHIVALAESEAHLALTRFSETLWRELAHDLPADAQYRERGTIWLAPREAELAEIDRFAQRLARHAVPCERLDPDALARAEPHLRTGLAGALLVPEDAIVDPVASGRFLLERAARAGARLLTGRRVRTAGKGRVRFEDGSFLAAEFIVLAAGVGSAEIAPATRVRPRAGTVLEVSVPSSFVGHELVDIGYLHGVRSVDGEHLSFNAQPRASGRLWIGSSRAPAGAASTGPSSTAARLHALATEFLPELGSFATQRVWTGERPAGPDTLPLIGPAPSDPSLIWATAHEGLGITTAPATARLVRDRIEQRPSVIRPEPYAPDRLGRGDGTSA